LSRAGGRLIYAPDARAVIHHQKPVRGQLRDAEIEGQMMARLWREDREFALGISRRLRRRRGRLTVLAIMAATRAPIPGPLASLLGRYPASFKGAWLLYTGLRMHFYFHGAGRELHGYSEWRDYLNRDGQLGR
jgi:hypothetical protein